MKETTKYTILHNSRCRKSREGLAHLESMDADIEVIEYLKTPITKAFLVDILAKLELSAENLLRKNESIYKEKFKGKSLTEDQWIDAMIEYPKLIERPIVIKGDRAVVARPKELIDSL